MSNETDARIIIDDQLRQAGWNPADKTHVLTEVKTDRGKPDYVLLDQRGRSLAVIEAKKNAIDPFPILPNSKPYPMPKV